ncbi:MAG: penicillin-binding protein 2 [Synergistaceae bacterium]|nr:penicillin-binding protein 2 [Synergistaceae bacterium]
MSKTKYAIFEMERRIQFLQRVLFVTFCFLLCGLVFFQILKRNEYINLASKNRLRIFRMPAPRGVITDINGAPLAANVRTFNINVYPVDANDEESKIRISNILQRNGIPMTVEKLQELIQKQYSAPYRAITLIKNLTFSQVAELVTDREFNEMLFVSPMWRRTYPASEVAAHAVGYVSEITKEELETRDSSQYRGGDLIGKTAIEAFYDDYLNGWAGESVIEVDARGRKLRDISSKEPVRGKDIILSVDLEAQRYAAELMGKYRGAVVAMDVNDGSIKCIYSSPSYDPNSLTWGISSKEWAALADRIERPMMNRAISGSYPPASTFKVVTASAALEAKTINTRTNVHCPGYFTLGTGRFRCWKRTGHGSENVNNAIRDSCDVFFYQTATWLGIDKLILTAEKYGVGQKTGIDLISEVDGTIAGPKWKRERIKEAWYGGDTVNYSIGQGYLLMTPLQLARTYAAIANNGKLVKPRLNIESKVEYKKVNISDTTIKLMQEALLSVTNRGTGRRANMFGVKLAGKTGTAQNSHGEDHAWFVGYGPEKNPKYVVVAIAEAGRAGSEVTAPIVGKMLNYLVNGKKYVEPKKVEEQN